MSSICSQGVDVTSQSYVPTFSTLDSTSLTIGLSLESTDCSVPVCVHACACVCMCVCACVARVHVWCEGY